MSKFIVLLIVASAFEISQADIETVIESSDSESYSSSLSLSSSSSSSDEWVSSSSYQPPIEECGPPVIRPSKCSKPNEVLEICPARCPFRTCGIDDTLIDCAPSPVPGDADCPPPACRCKPQFFRNDKGKCVPWEKCPICKNPNEIYDPCDASCPGRRCDVDLRLVKCKPPPQVGDPDCVAGCRCIDGYLRDCNGVCIPKEKCPPLTPVCGPNEVYDPCPNCSPQTCETMNATYSCPAIPADKTGPGCNPSCRCIKGYYRNKIGECIAASDCLKCTKKHEYFSCGGACDNVCENIKEQNQTNCPIINVKCNEMCYCEKDYARDYKNDCIPIKDCPTCPANERYDPCPATLCQPKTCDEAGYPLNCTQGEDGAPCPGKPGCVCKDGYLRNKKGICIPTGQCPSCGGDKNATLGCGVNCNRHCSNLNQKELQSCILICYPNSCDCKTDKNGKKYYYDDNTKKCVLPQDCTKCKNPNEVYDRCDAPCPGRRCDVDPRLVRCKPPPKVGDPECLVGCRCIDGYARNSKGVCIPRKKCPPKIPVCGSNEEYDPCPDCSPQTCETMNAKYHCPLIPANKTGSGCKPSCRCKKGYFRNKIGQCIAASDCLKCTKKHEYFSCGGACDNVCENIKEQNQTNCPIINVKCNEMCYCEKDYARDYKNDCIPIKDCPTCPANERYDPCPATLCQPKTCDEAGYPLNCTQGEDGAPCSGKPGCVCKDGYLRNKKGICIPTGQCPSCGGDKNATLGCGVNCNRHCSNLNQKELQSCILICYPNSCDCKTDKNGKKYYYDDNTNKCVLPQDCTKPCKKNEVYTSCANGGCGKWNCTQYDEPILCIDPIECLGGCICKKDYLRAPNGICIPQDQCPAALCPKPNEVYDSCILGCPPRKCGIDDRAVLCLADQPCQPPGCRCKDGYYRNDDGICVTWEECPKPLECRLNEVEACVQVCPPEKTCENRKIAFNCANIERPCTSKCISAKCKNPNEVYDRCDAPCPGRRCDVDPRLVRCKPPPKVGDPECLVGCRCIDGYARNSKGVCIPRKKCPPKIPVCGSNEEYDPCPDCSPQTCETMNATYHCPLIPANKTGSGCKPSCRCKKGYFRNKIGQCIAASDCLKCTKKHEYFSCGGACDNVCENIKEQNQTNCPIINVKCNEMCYCEKDYARDYKNDCIPIKHCPTCPANERYDPCPATLCQPKTCAEAGFPLNCTQGEDGAPCPGKPGCVCKDGYLRNKKGICIPTGQCPSCGGDKNATLGCGVNCNRHCSNLNQKRAQLCILICNPNSCDCRTDKNGTKYYYDDNTKQCVLPHDCTPQCKKNEVYSECINGGCGKQNCTEINKPVVCKDPKECKTGCICAPGYLRAKNGTCVPSEQCDPPPNCKPNEEFSKCGRDGCLKYYCSDLDLPPLCRDTFQCIPQCECKEGYLRASYDNNTCVLVKNCKKQCKENEQYSDCPSATCRPQTCKQAGYPVPCPIVGPDGQCSGDPGCICVPGYLRNDKGICIPQKECPSCGGDKNATPGCGTHCGNTCATYNSTKPVVCPLICNLNGCDCKKKYVYDGNLRKCVLPENCTPTCKINEEFSTCVEGICRAQNCTDKDKSIPCPDLTEESCTSGCVCKEHYLRAKNGTCVPEDQCDHKKCPDNEQYSECPAALCQPRTCKQAGYPIPCSFTGPSRGQCPGGPGCICNPNYLRNNKGICIPKKDCPSCGGDENAIPGCGNHCGKTCATYKKPPRPCPLFCNVNGCDCKDKYIYDDNLGKCVLPKKCTPTCQVNEEFTNCTNAICRPQDCADKGKVIAYPAVVDKYCTAGCVCKKNFLRAKNGTCIPEDQCEPTCPDDEILSDCPPVKCDAEYCPKSRDDPQKCPTPTKCGPPRCVCGFNRHRDRKTGKCIATADCPPFPCDCPNEKYQPCPPVCPGENCTDYLNNATCPKYKIGIVVPCKPACRCIKGYYRNLKGICVSAKECKEQCKENEQYSDCPSATCQPQTCKQAGYPVPCPIVGPDGKCSGEPGCICKPGYLRNDKGICIPKKDCPSCGGDKNAIPGCGDHCGKSCATYKKGVPCLPSICNLNGCDCRDKYIYDSNLGKCVLPENCTKCYTGEVYSECANGICQLQDCSQYGQPLPFCPAFNPDKCKPGCICASNYLRNEDKVCVPQEECPEAQTCEPDCYDDED